jgi:hypothetical protein
VFGSRTRLLGGSWAVAVLVGCAATHAVGPPASVAAPEDVASTLLRIGDAGKPARGGEPVLHALTRMAAAAPERTTVLFLGDNVYPRGMPDSLSPDRPEAERRLRDQIAAVRAAGVRGIFIPGNHDWARHAATGWAAIQRQEAVIRGAGGPVVLLPGKGCPGPAVVDVGARVRLVLLDTQWWLHGGPKPEPPDTTCVPDTEAGVADSVRGALRAAGSRLVIVAGHHPLESGGEHGGHFGWKDYLFPLRKVASWLWVPLPLIGSIYPIARQHGVSAQDLSGASNRRMRAALEDAFEPQPPLVYASGHEHALQVFQPARAPYVLVSGAGILGHEGRVTWRDDTRFASSAAGFMRLDVLQDRRVRLGVWTVDRGGAAVEAFSMWLERAAADP